MRLLLQWSRTRAGHVAALHRFRLHAAHLAERRQKMLSEHSI